MSVINLSLMGWGLAKEFELIESNALLIKFNVFLIFDNAYLSIIATDPEVQVTFSSQIK